MKTLPIAGFEVPDRYNKDLLHLMVVNANSLYVYWEISDRRRWLLSQHFECDYGVMPKVLRLYDVTHQYFDGNNAHASWDVVTTPEAANWYFHQLAANRTYLVDIGTYTWEHDFIPLLRSNCVATPRDSEAPWGEPLQIVVPEAQTAQHSHRLTPSFFENIQTYSPYAR
ncbi:hypothetical protein GCM10008018_50460 [Paenibacillus marchantiophytorum]|uniref:DUF4912 domain-containing protein n=1 Tax=Paenibacillus marchantiophytorum TaxID=1619310 RepID=A0ABQ1F368_9BACL|nr:DUF4912 domain-containing protein [Paenibacillus marchantiophytorum]GFZ98158.1 hypothetical protein GCM10008018_50460 [Paenibacillus marchantiophytorum]